MSVCHNLKFSTPNLKAAELAQEMLDILTGEPCNQRLSPAHLSKFLEQNLLIIDHLVAAIGAAQKLNEILRPASP